ncbi:GIY-YIG nuclease [Catovirus CTV1]|uniref:GIY-YIG nuclease n=1 Tax=Catovirus CTV1 TaxID=1977631 RepID=A0A1V0SC14_9VIRU|nr:GIY-YIG nuclease [Catovirus CTV1]
MTKIIGTYKIINKKTQKYYYGSSKNIYVRIIQHKSQLKNNKHHCVYLQNSYNKYGKDSFYYEIDKICNDIDDALKQEQYVIDNNKENLYNISKLTSGGDIITNHPNREQILRKIKESRN